jgi:rare lipoprotein A
MKKIYLLICISAILFTSCSKYITKTGRASFYADKYHGRKTANGEIFSQNEYTAAHKKLPFGTKVIVTNLNNNKTVTVRINDRGPFVKGRIIDLSKKAASDIGMVKSGVATVKIKYKRKNKN